jgi:hypothetical protein
MCIDLVVRLERVGVFARVGCEPPGETLRLASVAEKRTGPSGARAGIVSPRSRGTPSSALSKFRVLPRTRSAVLCGVLGCLADVVRRYVRFARSSGRADAESINPDARKGGQFFLFAETLRAWVGRLKAGRMSLVGVRISWGSRGRPISTTPPTDVNSPNQATDGRALRGSLARNVLA